MIEEEEEEDWKKIGRRRRRRIYIYIILLYVPVLYDMYIIYHTVRYGIINIIYRYGTYDKKYIQIFVPVCILSRCCFKLPVVANLGGFPRGCI